LGPITPVQLAALFVFLLLSVVDVVLSTYLIFGAGGYVERNPLLAWASGSTLSFIPAAMGVKAIGAGWLALLVSFANRFSTLAGHAVLAAAIGTTAIVLLVIAAGAVTTLLAAVGI